MIVYSEDLRIRKLQNKYIKMNSCPANKWLRPEKIEFRGGSGKDENQIHFYYKIPQRLGINGTSDLWVSKRDKTKGTDWNTVQEADGALKALLLPAPLQQKTRGLFSGKGKPGM